MIEAQEKTEAETDHLEKKPRRTPAGSYRSLTIPSSTPTANSAPSSSYATISYNSPAAHYHPTAKPEHVARAVSADYGATYQICRLSATLLAANSNSWGYNFTQTPLLKQASQMDDELPSTQPILDVEEEKEGGECIFQEPAASSAATSSPPLPFSLQPGTSSHSPRFHHRRPPIFNIEQSLTSEQILSENRTTP